MAEEKKGASLTEAHFSLVDQMFGIMDEDDNGSVDFEEMYTLMKLQSDIAASAELTIPDEMMKAQALQQFKVWTSVVLP